jgi:cytochrome oxidase assembly protein ShyY1
MADIDIVPRHRSYLWLWILIAIVVLAVLWYALAGHRGSSRVGQLGVGRSVPAVTVGDTVQA